MSKTARKPWKRRAAIGSVGVALLLSADQCGNVVLLEGDPDQTISTSCGMRILADDPEFMTRYFCYPLCWGLDKIDLNHCKEARE